MSLADQKHDLRGTPWDCGRRGIKSGKEAEAKLQKSMMIMNLDFKKFVIIPETEEAKPTESQESKPSLQRIMRGPQAGHHTRDKRIPIDIDTGKIIIGTKHASNRRTIIAKDEVQGRKMVRRVFFSCFIIKLNENFQTQHICI